MMETVLYEDFPNYYPATMNMNSMKRKLTLNLNMDSGDKNSVIKKAKVASLNTPIIPILNTPDLAKCKLDTPDLERVIVQQISSLPTPNVNANQMFFSESETSEAKAASAEFEQALCNVRSQHEKTILQNSIVNTMDSAIIPTTIGTAIKIKKDPMLSDAMLMGTVPSNGGVLSTGLTPLLESAPSYLRLQGFNTYDSDLSQDTENSGSTSSSMATTYNPTYTTTHLTNVPVTLSTTSGAGLHKLPDYTTVSAAGNIVRVPVSNDYGLVTTTVDYTPVSQSMTIVKEEYQTVPQANSPSVSPIDMEDQERIKLERKRQRNRVAASKCRQRKLERISKLEGKVKQLKNENSDLSSLSSKLREQVLALKQQINSHVQNGCQIMMPQGVQQNNYMCM